MKRITLLFFHFFIFSFSVAFAEYVAPLLDGWVRHQKDPFNRCCPVYIDDNGKNSGQRCQVGCVATALESIISYHRREIVLQDVLPAWSTKNFTTTDIPAGTTVDTRLILPDYGDGTAVSVEMSEEDYAASVDAVARLSLMCGMMAQMNWGLAASGADAGDLVEPMKNILGWKTAEYIDSYKYTPAQWREILKNELRNGRPILYTGYTVNIDGHAFVIDGFDENDRFHVNWGYGSSYYDHYYDITELCPFANPDDTQTSDVMQGFFCNQQALLLSPDEVDLSLAADSLKRTGKEIDVESVRVEGGILTGKYTPVTFTLRNTSDLPLTTPFEVFTNTAYDKDLFREGDYGALFGVTLEPGERRTMTVPCLFSKKGSRTLHVSPDDVTVLGNRTVSITSGSSDALSFEPVEVTFSRESEDEDALISATFNVPIKNGSILERAGSMITYGLMPSTDVVDGDWRHYEYCFLPANDQATSSVTFKGLTSGDEHLFVVRWPWKIQQSCTFTVPSSLVVGVPETLVLQPMTTDDALYDLSGRRTAATGHGLLIHNGKKTIR